MAVKIYVIHSQAETSTAQNLELFLYSHIRRGRIQLDGAYKHLAGGEPLALLREGIQGADLIVLLVSVRLFVEAEETIGLAMVRSKLRLAPVVPVLLNHVSLREGVLDGLVTLPRDPTRHHVADFSNQDEAWLHVANGILSVVDELPAQRERLRRELAQPSNPAKVQMLFLAANPKDTGRLQLSLELSRVQARLESLGLTQRFELKDKWRVDPGDLASALVSSAAQVVHISGHGQASGSILLEGLRTEPTALSGDGLRQLLLAMPQRPQLLVLNSCFAGCEAATLTDAADAVIGYLDPVADKDAILFADILYMNLAQGRSVRASFEQARAVVRAQTRVVLTCRQGVDPEQLQLRPPLSKI